MSGEACSGPVNDLLGWCVTLGRKAEILLGTVLRYFFELVVRRVWALGGRWCLSYLLFVSWWWIEDRSFVAGIWWHNGRVF